MMFTTIKTGYLEFLGKFRTEPGVYRSMRRAVRRELASFEESRKSLERYHEVVKRCNVDGVNKELRSHYLKAVDKEIKGLKEILDYTVEENKKLLRGIIALRDDLLRDAENEVLEHAGKAEKAASVTAGMSALTSAAQKQSFSNAIIRMTNELLKEYEQSINSQLQSVAGFQSLSLRSANLLETESLLRDVQGKLIKDLKEAREKNKKMKTTEKDVENAFENALKHGGNEEAMRKFNVQVEGTEKRLFDVYKELFKDAAEMFNEVMLFTSRFAQELERMAEESKPYDAAAMDKAPPSVPQLLAQYPQGLGYPKTPGTQIEETLSSELVKFHKMLKTFIEEARLQLSDVEHSKMRAGK